MDRLKSLGDFQKQYQRILLQSTSCALEQVRLLADDILLIDGIFQIITQHTIHNVEYMENTLMSHTNDNVHRLKLWAENVRSTNQNEERSILFRAIKENTISSEKALSIKRELCERTEIDRIKLDSVDMYGYCLCIPPIHCRNDAISFAEKFNLQLISSSKALYRFKSPGLSAMQIEHQQYKQALQEVDKRTVERHIKELHGISGDLYDIGMALCEMDVAASFAKLSIDRNYVRPQFRFDSQSENPMLEILGGRHPVIESMNNGVNGMSFVSNDCIMDNDHLLSLITGPNMAGKSTYLRQTALLILMAQSGLYVPCDSMVLSIFDAIFVRFGSNDALFKDESTFMLEMKETADILRSATKRSFIVMDEISKSTAPKPGQAIAEGVIKYIHDQIGCRCLFSTHFHECCALQQTLEQLRCYHMRTEELGEGYTASIRFTHKLVEGACCQSHALYIAKLAGIPQRVLDDAASKVAKVDADPGQ